MRKTLTRSVATVLALLISVPVATAATATLTASHDETWQALTTSTLNATGRGYVRLSDGFGKLSTLRLRSTTGAEVQIRQLVVEFTDGSTLIRRGLAEQLHGGKPLKLDLDAGSREVRRLVVYGDVGAKLDVSAR